MNCTHGIDTRRDVCVECVAAIGHDDASPAAIAYDRGFTDGANAARALIASNLRQLAAELREGSADVQPFSVEWRDMQVQATAAETFAEMIARGELCGAVGRRAA